MGGEAHKTHFHFQDDKPDSREPRRPEPPDGVGVWGVVVHMLLMVPLVPTTIIDALVTVWAVLYFARALRAPGHHTVVSSGSAPASALLLAAFLLVMVVGLALLTWVVVLLATVVLDRRRWRLVLGLALGLLALGAAVWAFTAAGLPATASVFGVYAYVALVAVGHLLWARRRPEQRP